MNELTATGQSVEQAIQSALDQLGVEKDQVEIEIMDEGKKGLFGLFGNRPASVKVTVKSDPVKEVEAYLLTIAKEMGANIALQVTRKGKQVDIDLTGNHLALFIGKRGQTLNSLQQLAQLVANRYSKQYINITLDAENYRQRREETLKVLAKRMADKAVKTNRTVHLEPLPSFERKIIHAALAHNYRVKTYSEGAEPNRYIVITAHNKVKLSSRT